MEDKEDDLEGARDRKNIFFVWNEVPEEAGTCTLWAGTRKVRGFATGQGRGWPLSKTPLPADDSYGLKGKGCHEELRQALNIMSNCVTRSEAEEITQFRIMSNVPGHSAPTVIRVTEPVRSLHLPLGGWEGLDQHGELAEDV